MGVDEERLDEITGRGRQACLRAIVVSGGAMLLLVSAACSTARTDNRGIDEPRTGGVLRLLQEAPSSLDPIRADSVYESLPVNQLFDGLVRMGPSLNIEPAIAETWTVCRAGISYVFDLRRGVRFHDGSQLTADDVVYSIRRILEPGAKSRSLAFSYLTAIEGATEYSTGEAKDVVGLKVVDDHTVEIQLVRPYPSFLEVLAMVDVSIVPRSVVEAAPGDFGRRPIGTGPFRMAEWTDKILRLEANPDYFGRIPLLDGLAIHFSGGSKSDDADRLVAGDIDVIEPSGEAMARLEHEADVRVFRYQELSLAFLGLNSTHPPLDSRLVRRAIAHAIDREALVTASPELRRSAVGVLPPGINAYSPEIKTLRYSPEMSRRLLAEAGFSKGSGLAPIELWAPQNSSSVREVLARIRDDLEAVGIQLDIRNVTWAELDAGLSNGAAPAFLLGWVADLTDPDAFMHTLFKSGGAGNYFAYNDKRTDMLLTLGARETNSVERARLYRQLESHVLDNAPIVPLYHTRGVVAMRYEVAGLTPGPLGLASVDFERVWFRSSRGPS